MRRAASALAIIAILVIACSGMNSRPGSARTPQSSSLIEPTTGNGDPGWTAAFAPIRQSGEATVCGSFLPPRLVTVSSTGASDSTLKVDVVVGPDGAVESVLILDGGRPGVQKKIADRVSRWIYKPALCNGVPVASEGRIEIRGE